VDNFEQLRDAERFHQDFVSLHKNRGRRRLHLGIATGRPMLSPEDSRAAWR
jgi:hypothetical protein